VTVQANRKTDVRLGRKERKRTKETKPTSKNLLSSFFVSFGNTPCPVFGLFLRRLVQGFGHRELADLEFRGPKVHQDAMLDPRRAQVAEDLREVFIDDGFGSLHFDDGLILDQQSRRSIHL
jgi:hypothetical protein